MNAILKNIIVHGALALVIPAIAADVSPGGLRANGMAANAAGPAGGTAPTKIILDVDCYSDFDDVGALACLHALADAGECEILATCVSTSDGQTKPALAQVPSVPTVEIVNAYYGRSDLPVGATHKTLPVDVSGFTKTIGYLGSFVKNWKPAPAHGGSLAVEDAVSVYRRTLANAPDGSVTVCSTGFLSNLGQLLDSPADSISALTGKELVATKVKALYAMSCTVPNGREFNTYTDSAASKNVVDNWPTDIYFLTSNYGDNVRSGVPVSKLDATRNPVAAIFAHELTAYGETATGHASWDEVTVLAAVRGWERHFSVTRGTMTVAVSATWSKDGKNSWMENATGRHYVLGEKTSYAEVGILLDELMTRAPGTKPETHEDAAWQYVPGLLTKGRVDKGYPFFLAERLQASHRARREGLRPFRPRELVPLTEAK